MANKKLEIDGEVADKKFPFTTTDTIFNTLAEKAMVKKISINQLLNNIAYSWVKKATKNKKQSPVLQSSAKSS